MSFPNDRQTDYVDLNVVVLPDNDLSSKLIQWSALIASTFKTNYILDANKHLPHLSLYSARYPLENKQLVEERVNDISRRTRPFDINLHGFSFFSGYFFYDAEKSNELMQLHVKIVDVLNRLREGLISDNQKQLKGLSLEQEKAIEEYGYVSVKKLYMPHISITQLAYPNQGDAAREILPKETSSFSVKTLGISYFAEYGTFPAPLKKYSVND